ncbi:Pyrroline-5-carboxylate reductase [bacterium HR19]|nr:Pyrroline-5-carboxylate reductase [bacterium HR19]
MKDDFKIGIVGVGKMGSALARALSKDFPLLLYDKFKIPDDLRGFQVGLEELVSQSHIVIVAVKPKDFYDVAGDISLYIGDKLFVSVCAGIRADFIRRFFKRWARVMPSITCEVGEGIFAVYSHSEDDSLLLKKIFENCGKVFIVGSDDEIDIFTATSASAVGYFSPLFEAFEDALVRCGLQRSTAREVSAQTFLGIAKLIIQGKTPSQIKEEVMTPAGITAEAFVEITKSKQFIFSAVEKALAKAKEISEKMKK